jgi:DNA mismatch endonuclease (patch repair protein)
MTSLGGTQTRESGPPPASSGQVRQRMRRQARKDTGPELALRRRLWRRGLRYRINLRVPGERGSIDVAFTRRRLAIFVDGCFWHSCPAHGTIPKANRDWWESKLLANRERDARYDALLESRGWSVVRVWEHEDPDVAAASIARLLQGSEQGKRDLPANGTGLVGRGYGN